MQEFVTYNREVGFNIIRAYSEQEAELKTDSIVLDTTDEFDEVILDRIRELLTDG